MSEIILGADALNAMNNEGGGAEGDKKEFSSFKVGTEYTVRVINETDSFGFYSYGFYHKNPDKGVRSFVPKNPSKKTAKGFPIENLTSWDKAFMYHRDKSDTFGDEHSQEAYKFKPELRFVMGFFDLDTGEKIVIDVSRKQAQTIQAVITKNGGRLDKRAFELSKGEGGSIMMMPISDLDDELSETQRKNFDKAPEEFNIGEYTDSMYKADEDEMLDGLIKAGFDITLIGYGKDEAKTDAGQADSGVGSGENGEITDDDLPF